MTDNIAGLVEEAEGVARALIALSSGATLEAVGKLPPCDPVTTADLLERATTALTTLSRKVEELEAVVKQCRGYVSGAWVAHGAAKTGDLLERIDATLSQGEGVPNG